jgi:hypothetical protein
MKSRLLAALAIPLLLAPARGRAAEPAAAPPGDNAGTAPPAAEPAPGSDGEIGAQPLPPGTPADVALWKSAVATSNQITIERARASRVQVRLKTGRYPERLSAMGTRDPDSAGRARDLRRRLDAAWTQNYAFLTARWPVDPTRGCGYPALQLYSALHGGETPQDKAMRLEARADVETCLRKARPAVETMKKSTDDLEAVAAEVDAALAAVGLGSPTSVPAADVARPPGQVPAAPTATK